VFAIVLLRYSILHLLAVVLNQPWVTGKLPQFIVHQNINPAIENANIDVQEDQLSAPSQPVDDHTNSTSVPCDESSNICNGGVESAPCSREASM